MPGSKSVTNRALVLAALASDPDWLRRPLRSRDTLLMADGLRALGVQIDETVQTPDGGEAWRVIPAGLHGPAAVDVGNAGTVMRFLPPVAALADGDVALRRRPAQPRTPAARRDRRAARARRPDRRRGPRRAAADRASAAGR